MPRITVKSLTAALEVAQTREFELCSKNEELTRENRRLRQAVDSLKNQIDHMATTEIQGQRHPLVEAKPSTFAERSALRQQAIAAYFEANPGRKTVTPRELQAFCAR